MKLRTGNLLVVLCFIISSGCGVVTASSPTAPAFSNLAPIPLTETFTPLPPPATLSPTAVSLNLHPQIIVLAENLPEPDDLVLAPDGSIYISDVTEGTIKQYTSDGQLHPVLSGLNAPEGMAFLPDGSLVIAEQGRNRLLHYDFHSGTLTPFLDLANHTNNAGVDGILWGGANLIVPDSPNGTVLEVSPDGKAVRQLVAGLVRPTGAWTEPNGNFLIADEYGNAVFRLHRDGTLEKVGEFPTPDDVVEDAHGNIFVAALGDNAIHVFTANQDAILVGGLKQPQGLIFDTGGNLIVTDPGNHRLLKVLIH